MEKVLASSAVRNYLGPALIIAWSAPFVILQVYAHVYGGGSFTALGRAIANGEVLNTVKVEVMEHGLGAAKMIVSFWAFQLMLMLLLPGKAYDGPRTVTGHVPKYCDNGLLAYVTMLVVTYLVGEYFQLFNLASIYDHYLAGIVFLNVFALIFCLFLYLKGRFAPTSTDNQLDGIFIADYYRGVELYPRIGKNFDIKMFTNCRFGMMVWALLPIAFAAKQRELYGEISNSMWLSVVLQLIYCFKFFTWERGYMGTVDIMHDRAGYYICWGCLCYLPSTYTAHTLFLVKYPYNYSTPVAAFIFIAGVASILVNYWADYQRQQVRDTGGKCKVWGKDPEMIHAMYTETRDGKTEKRTRILLASGFWGISRHFHYVPEIMAAIFWSAPLPHGLILPYFYVIFLTILLFDRAGRDDRKCAEKYGPFWTEYRTRVPYRIIPYIY